MTSEARALPPPELILKTMPFTFLSFAAFLIALTGLEIVIAFLQAYVFAILTCLYINDAIHLH